MIEQRNRSRQQVVDGITRGIESLNPGSDRVRVNDMFVAQYSAMIDILLDIRDNARRAPKYYQVVWGQTTSDLSEKVMNEMKFGWSPLGGAVESEGAVGKVLIQTLIKYE